MSKQIIITQNDSGISIVFNITENKKPYELYNKTCECTVVMPNGKLEHSDLNILNSNYGQVELLLNDKLTAEPGLYKIYINIKKNNNKVTAQRLVPYFVLEQYGGVKDEI